MSNVLEIGRRRYTFSKTAFQYFLNWFFVAAISFLSVILFYQLTVGIMSYVLGYETIIHFGKVDSSPHTNEYWGNIRVMLMYALPGIVILLFSVILLGRSLFGSQKVSMLVWFRFWIMVFGFLLSTTLMSLSLFYMLTVNGSLFQGYAVVIHWFGWPLFWSILLTAISGAINFTLGFLCSPVLIFIAPPDFMIKEGKRHASKIVLNSFVYTLLLIFPAAIFLSLPVYMAFFAFLFCHAFLWLLGLFTISDLSLRKRREARVGKETLEYKSNYLLGGITVFLVIIIRILFT